MNAKVTCALLLLCLGMVANLLLYCELGAIVIITNETLGNIFAFKQWALGYIHIVNSQFRNDLYYLCVIILY